MSSQLLETILDENSIRTVNFFNGRLLSAEDLRQEQKARLELDSRIAKALGEGVAYGLEVSTAASNNRNNPVLKIEPGLALNRRGRSLELYAPMEITLKQPASGAVIASSGFQECQPLEAGVYVVGAGVYLLVMSPAQGREGRAAVSGLGNESVPCNTKSLVEGVQFRLVSLTDHFSTSELSEVAKLRNRVAYRCLGENDLNLTNFHQNPFSTPPLGYGLIDALRPNKLTRCDVPLAVLHWTLEQGIRFVDLWAVRRRPHRPASSLRWNAMLGDRVLAEAEARLHQFEDTLSELVRSGDNLETLKASDRFGFLPPAGFLPIGQTRIKPAIFFGSAISGSIEIERSKVRDVLERSLYHEPLVFSSATNSWSNVTIYTIKDNAQLVLYRRDDLVPPVAPPSPDPAPQPDPTVKPGTVLLSLVDENKRPIDPKLVKRIWVQVGKQEYDGSWRKVDVSLNLEDKLGWYNLGRKPRLQTERKGVVLYSKPYQAAQTKQAAKVFYNSSNVPKYDLGIFEGSVRYDPVFQIPNVPAGTCSVLAMVQGYAVASQVFELGAGDVFKTVLTVPFFAEINPGLGIYFPPEHVYEDPRKNKYQKVVIPDLEAVSRFPPRGWGDPNPVDFPPEVLGSVEDLLQGLLEVKPELGFVVSDPKIAFKSGFDPNQGMGSEPYAYIVTSDGQGIPVIAVTAERAVPGEISTSRSSVPELSNDGYGAQLGTSVLGNMDVFASAWGNLVAGQLEISTVNAGGLVSGIQADVVAAKADQAYYPGMTSTMSTKLKEAGLNTDAALANASPDMLKGALKSAGLSETAASAYAVRLIDNARGFTLGTGIKNIGSSVGSSGILDNRTKGLLEDAGFAALDVVANTGAADLASKLGIEESRAQSHVDAAILETLVSVGGLSQVDAQKVVASESVKTLSDLSDTSKLANLGLNENLLNRVGTIGNIAKNLGRFR
jgi:hypothetical protein